MASSKSLRLQLQEALDECERLRKENSRLRKIICDLPEKFATSHVPNQTDEQDFCPPIPEAISSDLSPEAKVTLFRNLFCGREDVYAIRWESKKGRTGYSPACVHDGTFIYTSDRSRPTVHQDRKFLPVTDEVIRDHLLGKHTVGIYPLLLDETCWFLAADFDKKSWREDAAAFLETCCEAGVPAALERSRSGNGGHIWIFFDYPIQASLARKLGTALLTRTMERRHQLGLDSYDRFFPNQDTMPKGGFGNLIALPLQRGPREKGNSVFLDEGFQPYADQWQILSTFKRTTKGEVEALVREASQHGDLIGVRMSVTDEDAEEDPWTLPPSGKRPDKPILEPLPERVRVVRGNLLYVEKEQLPSAMINRLIRLAAFQNPEFYKAQAMRLSTFGKPRVISCAEEFSRHIGMPRGCLDNLVAFLKDHQVEVDVTDERFAGSPITASYLGELRHLQHLAAATMLSYDDGVLCAPTAFGKTAVAAWLIAERTVNTLVLVHRTHLMDQWREQLALFLDIPKKNIGQVGGGKNSRTGCVDIGVIQSLNRKGVVKDWVADYGQVIVDECHHLSAFTFEQVLRQVKARYVVGLTATPTRKDGHHPIITMQCGPIRYNLSAKKLAAITMLRHEVIPRHTEFKTPVGPGDITIQDLYAALVHDQQRNELIISDLLLALEAGRSPLLLTERTEHLPKFIERLKDIVPNVFELRGGMGKKQRKILTDRIKAVPDHERRVIVATGRYIGEGFDDPRLDTLFLAMPISWRGTLQQYAGRIHRLHSNKRVVQVYDYVDQYVPMLARMYEKRLKGYKAIGYAVREQVKTGLTLLSGDN